MFRIGTDICSVERIKTIYDRYGHRFLHKILTDSECQYVLNDSGRKIETLAGRFAAKEAVAKTFKVDWHGINWKEIEIIRLASGAPSVVLHGRAQALSVEQNLTTFEISISHEREYAIATVIAYDKSKVSGNSPEA